MMPRHFQQVDVFTAVPYRGNPLAVVLDAADLSTDQMQHFTNWTNLSEATFILPPTPDARRAGADYRVRIFCPGRELPFAGHPTLGTCHVWLAAGGRPQANDIVQECGAGLVRIRRDGQRLAFAAPPLRRSGPLDEADVTLIARGLGVPRADILHHAWCDNGPNWRGVMLPSAEQVLALKPDANILGNLDIGVVGPRAKVGVIAPHQRESRTHAPSAHESGGVRSTASTDVRPEYPDDDDYYAFEVRAFFPGNTGLAEDPVTGSLNAALAQWLIAAGLAPPSYVARQGTALGRDGRVHVTQSGPDIWIAGQTVTCISGTVTL